MSILSLLSFSIHIYVKLQNVLAKYYDFGSSEYSVFVVGNTVLIVLIIYYNVGKQLYRLVLYESSEKMFNN